MTDEALGPAPVDGVVALYADGGCIAVNPSPMGAPWAVCGVDAAGHRTWGLVGVVAAHAVAGETPDGATNNQAEFMAMLRGLESMPDGWAGTVYSDSLITIRRFRDSARLRGIPLHWGQQMGAALRRLGRLSYVLLDGHPTRAQLVAGRGKRGQPVSEHNVWCDRACTATGVQYAALVGQLAAAEQHIADTDRRGGCQRQMFIGDCPECARYHALADHEVAYVQGRTGVVPL